MIALNPNAIYRTPITIEDYLASRVISSPLRLYDCDTHIDGSTAILLSHRDVARDLARPPIEIEAMGMSLGGLGIGWHRGDFTALPSDRAGERQVADARVCAVSNGGFGYGALLLKRN